MGLHRRWHIGATPPLGDKLLAAYDANGGESARVTRMSAVMNDSLLEAAKLAAHSKCMAHLRRTVGARVAAQIPLTPTLDRQEQLDRSLAIFSFLQAVASAQEEAAALSLALLREKASAQRIWDFDESFTGPWDSLVTIWNTGGSEKSIFNELSIAFQAKVLSETDLQEFHDKVVGVYDQASRTSAKLMFDLATTSPKAYPATRRIESERTKFGVDPTGATDTTWLRLQLIVDAPVLPMLAVDGALIVGGWIGAPETAGLSLLLSLAGAAHFAWQTIQDSMAVIGHHVRRTTLLSVTHSTIADAVLGSSPHENTVVAKAVLAPQTDAINGWCNDLNHKLTASLPAYMEGVFGKEQP